MNVGLAISGVSLLPVAAPLAPASSCCFPLLSMVRLRFEAPIVPCRIPARLDMARRYLFYSGVVVCALFAGWILISLSVRTDESTTAGNVEPVVLPEADRELLWTCENGGNVLSKYGWSRLAAGTRASDPDAIAESLTADFSGAFPSPSESTSVARGVLTLHKSIRGEAGDPDLSASEFAGKLIALREQFGDSPSVAFAMLAIAPADREQPDGSWTGQGRLKMSGPDRQGRPTALTAFFDFDCSPPEESTLKTESWLSRCEFNRITVAQSDSFLMEEVAAEHGLDTETLYDNWSRPTGEWSVTTGGVYLCDFNRDGFTDVLVTEPFVAPYIRLYRGSSGGQFRDVTSEVGLPQLSGARHAVFADLDGDGWEDLLFPGLGLFKNLNGTTFRDMTGATNLMGLMESVGLQGITGLTAADYDLDGRVDLYLTRGDSIGFKQGSWIDADSKTPGGNRLYRNVGGGNFEDVTSESGTACQDRSVFTAAWLHANDDLWPDIYVIHEFGPGALLINRGDGSFVTQEVASASSDFGSMGLASGDVDNDGRIDLFVSNMYSKAGNRVMNNLPPGFYDDETTAKLRRMVAGSQIHRNLGDLRFEEIGPEAGVATVGWGWGATLVDLDNDGWLDLHATCGFMSRDRTKPDG